jgi:methionine salvage enolase-phosphatase E1
MTPKENTEANKAQTENIVKRILSSEIKYLIGVVIFLAGVVAPYYDIKMEIALIKQNHYTHIENMMKQVEKNSEEIKELKKDQNALLTVIAENSVRIKNLEK